MDAWLKTYRLIVKTIGEYSSVPLFFRGHRDSSWRLEPSIARYKVKNLQQVEQIVYFDFLTRAGSLLREDNSAWSNVFAMQHHGLPTRLLDWSENFAAALYFAIKNADSECCIWILDPFLLNEKSLGRNELMHPRHLGGDYEEFFIEKSKPFEGKCAAISPLRHHPRVFTQRSGFTVHDDIATPLEEIYRDVVKKIAIPSDAIEGAQEFLRLAGVSEFSLFPDLDGLAREIKLLNFDD